MDEHYFIKINILDAHASATTLRVSSSTKAGDICDQTGSKLALKSSEKAFYKLVLVHYALLPSGRRCSTVKTLAASDIVIDVLRKVVEKQLTRHGIAHTKPDLADMSNMSPQVGVRCIPYSNLQNSVCSWHYKDIHTSPFDFDDDEYSGNSSSEDESEFSLSDLAYLRQTERRGFLLKKSKHDPNVWRRRYCILTDKLWCLDAKRTPPRAMFIDLSNNVSLAEPSTDQPEMENGPYGITLNSPSGSHYFRARDENQQASWLIEFRQRIEFCSDNNTIVMAESILCDEESDKCSRVQRHVKDCVDMIARTGFPGSSGHHPHHMPPSVIRDVPSSPPSPSASKPNPSPSAADSDINECFKAVVDEGTNEGSRTEGIVGAHGVDGEKVLEQCAAVLEREQLSHNSQQPPTVTQVAGDDQPVVVHPKLRRSFSAGNVPLITAIPDDDPFKSRILKRDSRTSSTPVNPTKYMLSRHRTSMSQPAIVSDTGSDADDESLYDGASHESSPIVRSNSVGRWRHVDQWATPNQSNLIDRGLRKHYHRRLYSQLSPLVSPCMVHSLHSFNPPAASFVAFLAAVNVYREMYRHDLHCSVARRWESASKIFNAYVYPQLCMLVDKDDNRDEGIPDVCSIEGSTHSVATVSKYNSMNCWSLSRTTADVLREQLYENLTTTAPYVVKDIPLGSPVPFTGSTGNSPSPQPSTDSAAAGYWGYSLFYSPSTASPNPKDKKKKVAEPPACTAIRLLADNPTSKETDEGPIVLHPTATSGSHIIYYLINQDIPPPYDLFNSVVDEILKL